MSNPKTDRNQEIVSMRDFEGKSFREISDSKGITEKNVRKIYYREIKKAELKGNNE